MCPFLLFFLRLSHSIATMNGLIYTRFFLLALFLHHVKDLFCVLPLLPRASALVENNGFEPLTPCVQGRCSSQLS